MKSSLGLYNSLSLNIYTINKIITFGRNFYPPSLLHLLYVLIAYESCVSFTEKNHMSSNSLLCYSRSYDVGDELAVAPQPLPLHISFGVLKKLQILLQLINVDAPAW